MNGIGDILRVLNMEMVIGTISNTVVTLSINIDIVAVEMQNITINLHIFPLDALLIFTPSVLEDSSVPQYCHNYHHS